MRRSVWAGGGAPALLLAVALGIGLLAAGCGAGKDAAGEYYCPMHPDYVSDRPGDCPICNMRLVPRETPAAEAAHEHAMEPMTDSQAASQGIPGHATVELDPRGRQLAGVQTAVATRERLAAQVRTVGIVQPDETLLQHVHVKVGGFVEKLHVGATGQFVRRGDPTFDLYSPELVASQEEFLRALEAVRRLESSVLPEAKQAAQELLAAARRRLELYDVPAELIAELERTGEPRRTVTMRSQATGYVVAKTVVEGHQVEPGMTLLTVADLRRVWVQADFYENEAHLVRVGQTASLQLPYDPGRSIEGKVAYVYPYVDPTTRTLDVRFEFANPGLELKPSMFVDVRLEAASQEGIVVPESAVLDTGERQLVFVERSTNRFEPREVRTGLRTEGKIQVLSGVAEGDTVVVHANFLLDSESRLRGALGGSSHQGHEGMQP